jgi:hypothetical protein
VERCLACEADRGCRPPEFYMGRDIECE